MSVGGQINGAPADVNVFSPQNLTFSTVASRIARAGAAVASPSGREVVVAGGESNLGKEDTSDVYDSQTNTLIDESEQSIKDDEGFFKIAFITLAQKNAQLIQLLKERGLKIKENDLQGIQEVAKQIEQYHEKLKEEKAYRAF